MFARLFRDNPVLHAELLRQQRAGVRRLWRWVYALATLVYVGLLGCAIYYAVIRDRYPDDWIYNFFIGYFIVLAGLHVIAMAQAIHTGSTSIIREKQARTWEPLLLTGVDARRIVVGKWWAAVRKTVQDHFPVHLLQAGFIIALAITDFESETIPAILMSIPFTIAFGLVWIGASGAAGVLMSLLHNRGDIVTVISRVIQVLLFGTTMVIIWGIFFGQWWNGGDDVEDAVLSVLITPLEGGMIHGILLIAPYHRWEETLWFIGFGLAGVLVFGLLTPLLLRLTQRIAVMGRALPPGSA